MECNQIIEPVDLKVLAPKAYKKGKVFAEEVNACDKSEEGLVESGIRYRLVDPWEVKPLNSREAKTRGASLGRHQHLLAFGLGRVASSCEDIFRLMGSLHLFELWAAGTRGRISLTKALATVHEDSECEALFMGPPCVLQVSLYKKKFMSDMFLCGADVKLDALDSGGQLEEWVPLKTETHGINWFARIRLTLRFELMCLAPENETVETLDELALSVGLRQIKQLCRGVGGAQLDLKKSVSTPPLLSYFESLVY
jgi:hypothetical protein